MGTPAVHRPVLLEEAITALGIHPEGKYVDGTFGRGGHARAILENLGDQGRLLVMDKDPDAIRTAEQAFENEQRVIIRRGSFAMLAEQVKQLAWVGQVNGILLDLGVSSPQLDEPARGFSFRADGPLDMRMDPEQGESAAQWLARAEEAEIVRVLKEYGEERFARRIARALIAERSQAPVDTTRRLAQIIAAASPSREPGKDPATRSFQAIRIHINRELEDLRECLATAPAALAPGGRLAVISFHSLEDRIVKRFMRDQARGRAYPPDLPVREQDLGATMRLVGKAVRASAEETRTNPRARSATLRVAERLQ